MAYIKITAASRTHHCGENESIPEGTYPEA